MDELLDPIRHAADQVGEGLFLELLRWHRAVAGLPGFDPTTHGAYPAAIATAPMANPPTDQGRRCETASVDEGRPR